MRFTVLNENTAGKRGFLAEHGLSVLIVHQGRKILFDTGQTDVFLHNAEKIGRLCLIWTPYPEPWPFRSLRRAGISGENRGSCLPVYVRKTAFLNKQAINDD